MMLAIVGVFLLINRQTAGFLEAFIMYILPLPMVFYSMKYGAKDSMVVFVAGILLAAILSTPSSLCYTASAFLIGLIYGSGVYQKKPMRRTMLLAMAVGALTEVLIMVVFAGVFGYDLNAEIASMQEMFSQVEEQSGVSFSSVFDMDQLIMELIVISSILTGVMEVIVTHLLVQLMMRRMHMKVMKDTPISEYYPAKWTGYAGLAGLLLYYYSVNKPLANDTAQMVIQSLGIVAIVYLFVWGEIAMAVLCRRLFHMGRGVTVLICLFCFMLTQFMMILGLVYIITHMHERILEEGGRRNAQ
jgi:hypothetical protein